VAAPLLKLLHQRRLLGRAGKGDDHGPDHPDR
jgi:hypothetical protein